MFEVIVKRMNTTNNLPQLIEQSRAQAQQIIANEGFTLWSYINILPENMLGILGVKDNQLSLFYLSNDKQFIAQADFSHLYPSAVRITLNSETNTVMLQKDTIITEGVLFNTLITHPDGSIDPGEQPTKWASWLQATAIQPASTDAPSALTSKKPSLWQIIVALCTAFLILYVAFIL